MIGRGRLQQILGGFPQLTVGVVGDMFLDRYLEIAPDAQELSVETGLDAYQIPVVRNSPGAAGTVLNNLAALGIGCLLPVAVIGDDGHGYDLRQELSYLPVRTDGIIADPNRLTPTYTKPLKQDAHGIWTELNRLDVRSRGPLSEETTLQLCQKISTAFEVADGIIILDQVNEENWGVINQQVRSHLHQLAQQNPHKLIFVDSRRFLRKFDFGVLKGNLSEVIAAADMTQDDITAAKQAAQRLVERTGREVFCTLGEEGILVTATNKSCEIVDACSVSGPVDIVGAGDSASSGIVMSWLAGATANEAAVVGNLVASVTVQQLGMTGTATPNQVLARWDEVFG